MLSARPRLIAIAFVFALLPVRTVSAAEPTTKKGLEQLRWELPRLLPTLKSPLARSFANGVAELPPIATRTLYRTKDKSRWLTSAEAARLPEVERSTLEKVEADEDTYYTVRWGSPLSYARPLDVLAEHGFTSATKKKILDFGFGYVSHLRLLALLGADAHGVDVDPMHPALYAEPSDQGEVASKSDTRGRVTLHHGRFPADEALTRAIGGGYDLIISKNVLKAGYIHPRREADPKRLIDLGVKDEAFLAAIHDALAPKGLMLIFNICPAQAPADKPYIPWADGQSPFTRAQWEKAGFEVLVFDHDDTKAVRTMARALGWDLPYDGEPGMDVEHDLFAWYTLVRRR